ncbi:MAG: amidophosphoribosyltransferase [Promethearchaeota archaeon]
MQFKKRIKQIREKPREYCAIFGVTCDDLGYSVSNYLYRGLIALQHRGQESTGISLLKTGGRIFTYKKNGLVSKVLNEKIISQYWGNVGIGHTRYATTGAVGFKSSLYMQPFHFKNNEIEFSMAFNGTIANFDEIKKKMDEMGRVFITNTDTEVLAQLIGSIALGTENWPEVLKLASKLLDGSYSLILMTSEGDIYAIRDPLGFKPLCIGELKTEQRNLYFVASESCAIDTVGGFFLRDVKPGEIVHLSHQKDIHSEYEIKINRTAICQFEYVYFARPDSIIDGISVAEARLQLGMNLAKNDPILKNPEIYKNAIVVPVPDSGRSVAVGYAKEAKLPYIEGLMKNRYVHRTFIMPSQSRRKIAVKEKLNPIKNIVKDKDVILLDDSIVRGTTTQQIVSLLREKGGAKHVHLRVSCPPIISPCYMGIDFPTTNELIAGRLQFQHGDNYIKAIQQVIGSDSLVYQTIDNLTQAIRKTKNELCLACLTGKYPLKSIQKLAELEDSIVKSRN